MHESELSNSTFDRYLDILQIEKKNPSLDALTEILRSHLSRIPFENISKLYYKKKRDLTTLISFDLYLDGIKMYNFGGTCYACNYYLYQLLNFLGYEVTLCGADMNSPDVHIVSLVRMENREFIVDAGYAAPFLEPLPRDLADDYHIVHGRDRYVLKPKDMLNRSTLHLFRDGILKHGYTVKPESKTIDHFQKVIKNSFNDSATFMNAILLVRFDSNSSIVINNLSLIESRPDSYKVRALANKNKLIRAVEKYFKIPEEIVRVSVNEINNFGDAWN